MIRLNDLEFGYGDAFRMSVADLSARSGERMAWSGPSGSGKTTLLNLVAGILVPQVGTVEACGTDLTRLTPALRRDFRISNIGLVFQEFELLNYLRVIDNVLLAFRISRALQLNREVRTRAERLIERVGLGDMISRRPDQLSHGQRQRVAICRALVTRPRIVLADEPTANLDPESKAQILDLLDEAVRDTDATLIVITHDRKVSDRFESIVEFSATRVEEDQMVASIRPQVGNRDA